MEIFLKRLKGLRAEEKLSQSAVAEKIGISLAGYQKIEHGASDPSLSSVIALADVFDVSIDYLTGRTDFRIVRGKERGGL